jgi:hypothetical protein
MWEAGFWKRGGFNALANSFGRKAAMKIRKQVSRRAFSVRDEWKLLQL